MLHAVDVDSLDDISTGLRVRAAGVGADRVDQATSSASNQRIPPGRESFYLRGLAEGKLIGGRSGPEDKIYILPRGANPTNGSRRASRSNCPTSELSPPSASSTSRSSGSESNLPYVAAYVLLDGADIPFLHLILECDVRGRPHGHARRSQVEASRRVNLTPSTPPSNTTREAPEMTSADIAVVGFAQAPHVREKPTAPLIGVEMLVPCFQQLYSDLGITKSDIGFWCSGSSGLPGRTSVLLHLGHRLHRSGPADQRISRRDADAAGLHEAWIKILTGEVETAAGGLWLRQILRRAPAQDPVHAARSVPRHPL
ncbi:unnamed protein product, partial [Mesorhabditis spiculigera]